MRAIYGILAYFLWTGFLIFGVKLGAPMPDTNTILISTAIVVAGAVASVKE